MSIEISDIVKDIKSSPNFKESLDNFLQESLRMIFSLEKTEATTNLLSVSDLLRIASIFSLSDDIDDKRLAYLISIYSWIKYQSDTPDIIQPINLILSRLSNFPALSFLDKQVQALKGQGLVFTDTTNIFSKLEEIGLKAEHSSQFLGNLLLTDFQKHLWDYLEANKSISFSAPTSAGKSFILKKFAIKKIKELEKGIILYILPSRALINEATYDLMAGLKCQNLSNDVLITSIPTAKSISKKIVYLLTQERAAILIETLPDMRFDLIIVDEAHAISNAQRGIILQNVLHDVLDKNDNTPIVFSCPFIKNMDFFSRVFNKDIVSLPNHSTNVIQNLISINIDESKTKIKVDVLNDGTSLYLGDFQSEVKWENLPDRKDRLTFFARKFTHNQDKSIIFANGPADAEQMANLLYDRLENIELDDDTRDLIKYIKEHLHKDFSLVLMLERGIAFHYGNLPTAIRIAIEDNFKNPKGKIKYLICTSTLLEGVNLPAKNIFIESPVKGLAKRGKPISSHEFWNLAGRAGRLTKDLYGNVFLINYEKWEIAFANEPKEYEVKSSLFDTIINNFDAIKHFLQHYREKDSIKLEDKDKIESACNKLFLKYKANKLDIFLQDYLQEAQIQELSSLLKDIDDNFITLPDDVIRKNPHISIIKQQDLYNVFFDIFQKNEIDQYQPIHPDLDEGNKTLRKILFSTNVILFSTPIPVKHLSRLTTLSSQWMKGQPVALMIENLIGYKQTTAKRKVSINTCVRDVLSWIEQDIRFSLMIRVKCYIDILAYFLKEKDIQREMIPLHLFLEMGASQQTMISLMGIGLSRPTAKTLIDKALSDKAMNEESAYSWLQQNKDTLEQRGITGVALAEIRKFV
jgi:hypothetical protein